MPEYLANDKNKSNRETVEEKNRDRIPIRRKNKNKTKS